MNSFILTNSDFIVKSIHHGSICKDSGKIFILTIGTKFCYKNPVISVDKCTWQYYNKDMQRKLGNIVWRFLI